MYFVEETQGCKYQTNLSMYEKTVKDLLPVVKQLHSKMHQSLSRGRTKLYMEKDTSISASHAGDMDMESYSRARLLE